MCSLRCYLDDYFPSYLTKWKSGLHYNDVIMGVIASQITSLTIVYSIVYSDADQRKHQSSASLAFVRGIHRGRWIPRTNGQLCGKCFHLMTSSWTRRGSVMLSADKFFLGSLIKWDLLAVRYCLYINKSVTMMLTWGTDIRCKSWYQNCFAFYVIMDFSQLNRSNSTGD